MAVSSEKAPEASPTEVGSRTTQSKDDIENQAANDMLAKVVSENAGPTQAPQSPEAPRSRRSKSSSSSASSSSSYYSSGDSERMSEKQRHRGPLLEFGSSATAAECVFPASAMPLAPPARSAIPQIFDISERRRKRA